MFEAVVFEDNVVFPPQCSYMFTEGEGRFGNQNLTRVTFGKIDTGNVTDMSHMFSDCVSLQGIDLRGMDTSAVKNMSGMFKGCPSLMAIGTTELDTSVVEDMSYMFSECSNLKSVGSLK